jgi:hypothetical protein
MRIFYAALVVVYIAWFSWYGGADKPVNSAELEAYIAALTSNTQVRGKDSTKPVQYMRKLAKNDDGNEFVMVNLIRFRDKAMYPPGSPWAADTDPMTADARYSAGVVPLLLKRGSLPIFVSSVAGGFINETNHDDWDMVAMVRYRSVRDMLEMMVEMSATDLAGHKWAAVEQTQVFPVKPVISLVTLRLTLAMGLILLGLGVCYLVNLTRQIRAKGSN